MEYLRCQKRQTLEKQSRFFQYSLKLLSETTEYLSSIQAQLSLRKNYTTLAFSVALLALQSNHAKITDKCSL